MGYTTEQWIISDNRHTRGVQKVRSLTQLATRYAHHILSLFNVKSPATEMHFVRGNTDRHRLTLKKFTL